MEQISRAADRTATGRPTKASIDRTISELMARQSGMVGQAQLRDAGLSARGIQRRVKGAQLYLRTGTPLPAAAERALPGAAERALPASAEQRDTKQKNPGFPTRGVFTADPGALSVEALRWRAVLAAPDDSYLADVSACAAHNLIRQRGTTMHVVHLGSGWDPPQGVIAHRTSYLPPTDRGPVDGLPCTSVSRSIFGAAGTAGADVLDELLDAAIALRVYNELDFGRILKRLPQVPGAPQLSAAMARLDEKSGEFLSNFERKTTRLVETSRLIPAPVVNVLVEGFRPDLHWLLTRAIVECDGRDYHRSLAQIAADERREEILRRLGYEILRLRWAQVRYEPERTLERIERFVLANRDRPVPRR